MKTKKEPKLKVTEYYGPAYTEQAGLCAAPGCGEFARVGRATCADHRSAREVGREVHAAVFEPGNIFDSAL